jgi:hypothetical protein
VTIMAANIRQSFAAITLRQQGYNPLDHPTITPRLRYTDAHQNGHLLRVLYLSGSVRVGGGKSGFSRDVGLGWPSDLAARVELRSSHP